MKYWSFINNFILIQIHTYIHETEHCFLIHYCLYSIHLFPHGILLVLVFGIYLQFMGNVRICYLETSI